MIKHSSRKNIKCQLPDEPLLNHTIKEAELITKSLDPILNGMLNDHDTDHTLCGQIHVALVQRMNTQIQR
ncbi:hypothetical protein PS15m_009916 [Mucor circinelloides]